MAFGFLFLDDGESLNSQNVHTRVIFSIEKGMLKLRKHGKFLNCENEEDINYHYKVFWISLTQCEFNN